MDSDQGGRAPADPIRLADLALGRPRSPFSDLPARLILVDVASQQAFLIADRLVVGRFPVSTAAAGVGGEEGSFRTPPGWHRIHARIGEDAPTGASFRDRLPTGEVWRGEPSADDLILTRILTLEGLEDSVNRGPGRDSLERYIYIHGTNHPEDLGLPTSHGCIRMSNDDVVRLFDAVAVGDPVVIVEGAASHAA